MVINVDVSPEGEERIKAIYGEGLDRGVLEAMTAEAYRQRKIGLASVRKILGFEDRWETIDFLSERRVYPNYNEDDADEDWATIQHMEARDKK